MGYSDAENTMPQYMVEVKMPICKGDILWFKETWLKDGGKYYFRADVGDWLEPCETLDGGYPASCRSYPGCEGCCASPTRLKWRPSIHMPKEAARIFLKVTEVRVERLQEITWQQALAEGVDIKNAQEDEECICDYCIFEEKQRGARCYGGEPVFCVDSGECEVSEEKYKDDCIDRFQELWNSTVKPADKEKYSWSANPWVWVYEFERVDKPEGM